MSRTRPRRMASSAISRWLYWLMGRSLSDGLSHVIAPPAQICLGVNVGGAPDRGASASRSQTERLLSACRHRLRQYRTLLGQTPSSRALTRTPTPSTACSMTRARRGNCWGVEWVRTSCSSSSRCSSLSSCPTAVHCARSRARSARACASAACSNHPLDPATKGKHLLGNPQTRPMVADIRSETRPASDRNSWPASSESGSVFMLRRRQNTI
jgi:hypothetical protein